MKDLISRYIIWRNSRHFSDTVPKEFEQLLKWDSYADDIDIYDIVKQKMKLCLDDGPRVDRLDEPVNNVNDAKRIIAIAAKVSDHVGTVYKLKWDESLDALFKVIDKYVDELKSELNPNV
ncbi:Anti-apoptotic Bcl-2-like protein [NY_014 poxvirus]|uniref:Anti-apoptotic Bcl-2-like protein n=1 Tax=NY_014 poxvirus TaxID=2025360 RepID=UPI000B9A06B2|nr:Anti-apoptotic Bcl-2-like protein [NY_014 poxvirus]AST09423.1 Anti-apoptotic Bcl-2-like protein [NY_014 poxvirus]